MMVSGLDHELNGLCFANFCLSFLGADSPSVNVVVWSDSNAI
jgi:hypothetical protein